MSEINDALLPAVMMIHHVKPEDSTDWTWHEEMEVGMVLEGTMTLHVEDHTIHLMPGDGYFINSQARHRFINQGSTYTLLYNIRFAPRLVGGSRDSIYWLNYINPIVHNRNYAFEHLSHDQDADKESITHMEAAFAIMQYRTTGFEFLLRNELSFIILDLYGRQNVVHTGLSQKDMRNELRIRQMLDCIENNYTRQLSVAQIAAAADISVSECIRCFKATIHTTPVQYLLQYRLLKASELLKQTDMNITDIGTSCGFSEMSYFTKCFRRQYHATPSQWRKNALAARKE